MRKIKKAYAEEEEAKKTGKTAIKEAMQKGFGDGKAKFDFKTSSVLM